jgi:polyferredoxin
LTRALLTLPWLLLLVVVVVAMRHLPFNLASLEPFDAYIFRLAGWATIAVAMVGLVASLFVPMAYCRFGCPTGAVLNFLRLQGRGDRLRLRDGMALGLLCMTALLYLLR